MIFSPIIRKILLDLAKNPVPTKYRRYHPQGRLRGEKGAPFDDVRVWKLKEVKGKEVPHPKQEPKSAFIKPIEPNPDRKEIRFTETSWRGAPRPPSRYDVASRSDLTDFEKKGAWYYQGDMGHEYKIINAAARYGTTDTDKLISISKEKSLKFGNRVLKTRLTRDEVQGALDSLDAAIEKSALGTDLTLYRGLKVINFEGGAQNLEVGDLVFDRAYASSTTDKNRGDHFAHPQEDGLSHMMRIHAPKGTKALWFNDIEHEVLFARNTAFEITNITTEGNTRYYDVVVAGEVSPTENI